MPFHLPPYTSTQNRAWDTGDVPYVYQMNICEREFGPEPFERFVKLSGDKAKYDLSTYSPSSVSGDRKMNKV